jgi:hypothetical protein
MNAWTSSKDSTMHTHRNIFINIIIITNYVFCQHLHYQILTSIRSTIHHQFIKLKSPKETIKFQFHISPKRRTSILIMTFINLNTLSLTIHSHSIKLHKFKVYHKLSDHKTSIWQSSSIFVKTSIFRLFFWNESKQVQTP